MVKYHKISSLFFTVTDIICIITIVIIVVSNQKSVTTATDKSLFKG